MPGPWTRGNRGAGEFGYSFPRQFGDVLADEAVGHGVDHDGMAGGELVERGCAGGWVPHAGGADRREARSRV